ncbi:hypothetical protein [Bradyrhizobium aeschynomenes]|uniref:hypothetical protein n=1 Tax=Bradyrhizobium aeschynomenes TaxID=2734909 RepID=UPI001551A3BD|nr:hypothetical protein [Bradyrhizobium aeschynomenes]NPV19290.1 hypothetical protein [Bradyrhizobium aeschynomenes]
MTPADPGGNPKIRLFRLQHDRLEPRAIEGSDKIFRDILTRVTSAEIGFRSQGQSITVEGEPWAELLAQVGLPSKTDRVRALQSNPIGVLLLAAWAKMLQGRRPDPQTAMSEFNEYRQAPAFISALSWHPRLSERAGNLDSALMKADADLLRRIALALGEPDVLGIHVTRDNWSEIWRALTEPSLIHQLIDARIRIDHAPADIRRVRETAGEFHDERRVRLALECCLDREMTEEAEALEAYLDNRDRDAWTPLSTLMGLQRTVQELVEDPIETPDEEPVSQLEGTDARSFDEMLTTIRRMIAEAQATAPVNGPIKAIARDFEQRLKSKRLDRRLLRQFEQRLTKIVGAPRNDDLARELTNRLEAWADLPNFAEMIRPRFRVLSDNSARKLDIIEALVNRIRLPAPRTAGYEFDRLRKHLSTCIQQRFTAARLPPSQDSKQMADDIAGYADILLHHRAWMALKQLVDKSQSAKDAADLHRFDQSIAVWPLQAAETWEMGRLISKEQFGNDDFLRKTLTPPDF